jgi:cytochrome P450 family 93 subfamily A
MNPAAVRRLTYGGQDFSFSAYGPFWRFMKPACVHEHLSGRTLDMLFDMHEDEAAEMRISRDKE